MANSSKKAKWQPWNRGSINNVTSSCFFADFVFDVDDVHISGGDIIDENENDKEASDEEKLVRSV